MTAAARFEADYIFETPGDPAATAAAMAGEQSSGTFISVPGETPELLAAAAARVERLEIIETVQQPSLPSARNFAGPFQRARVTLSWPLANIGPSLPNLVATVAGNLFELRQITGLKIEDIRLPQAFAETYPGPKFGVAGTRQLAGVKKGPLIGTIIKPSVGFNPAQTAALAAQLCTADIDFIKDDELQSDGPACPFDARLQAVMRVVDAAAGQSGRKTMVAFNITGDIDEMRHRHDAVLAAGGTCVMVSVNAIGLAGMIALGRHSQLPIHAHRNGWGYLSRAPHLGWSFTAWHKLWRLAGADHIHVNGYNNKFSESNDSVFLSARACAAPLFAENAMPVMPVFSSGQTVLTAAPTYKGFGSTDLIFAAGGGILAHPGGPGEGVRALRDAWDAAVADSPAEHHAKSHPALRAAMETFGRLA
ncbi:MAG: ribulose-bisphosphate carboxylase large subunit family protein [Beijerinckiaceae bacterium]